MPLSFLNPGLLFGAAAAALPVILHFLSRRRARKLAFSDLRFLEQAQSRQARSLGVRRWLLLLLRVLALLAVVAGAAGPRWGGLPATAGGGSYLFVLDASASSQARRGAGTVFGAARDDIVGIIRQLPPGSSVQVVIAGGRTAALFGDWLPAGEAAAAAVVTAAPGDGGFDLDAVLREATRQVARAPGAPVDIVLAGDLQAVPRPPRGPKPLPPWPGHAVSACSCARSPPTGATPAAWWMSRSRGARCARERSRPSARPWCLPVRASRSRSNWTAVRSPRRSPAGPPGGR